MKKEKGFVKFFEKRTKGKYTLREILDNLSSEELSKCIEDYAESKKKYKNFLGYETKQQLDFFVLNYLVQAHDVDIQDINTPLDFSVADIAEEIAEFLVMHDLVRVDEIEEFECPEGCTGCDDLKVQA